MLGTANGAGFCRNPSIHGLRQDGGGAVDLGKASH